MPFSLAKGAPKRAPRQVKDAYLFFDWFAIPQITARKQGESTALEAARAVQSIPAYVEACDLFFALVPELVHTESQVVCNYTSWLSRLLI